MTRGRVTMQTGRPLRPLARYGAGCERRRQPVGARTFLPAMAFPGADPGVDFNNFSPRVGFTYDVSATARRWRRPTSRATTVRWATAASPRPSTRSRRRLCATRGSMRTATRSLRPTKSRPARTRSRSWRERGRPRTRPTRCRRIRLIRISRTTPPTSSSSASIASSVLGFAIGANYIWRRYDNFQWNDRVGHHDRRLCVDDVHAAPASTCPGSDGNRISAATCPTVTYFQPTFQKPTIAPAGERPGLQSDATTASSSRHGSGCRTTG